MINKLPNMHLYSMYCTLLLFSFMTRFIQAVASCKNRFFSSWLNPTQRHSLYEIYCFDYDFLIHETFIVGKIHKLLCKYFYLRLLYM